MLYYISYLKKNYELSIICFLASTAICLSFFCSFFLDTSNIRRLHDIPHTLFKIFVRCFHHFYCCFLFIIPIVCYLSFVKYMLTSLKKETKNSEVFVSSCFVVFCIGFLYLDVFAALKWVFYKNYFVLRRQYILIFGINQISFIKF